MCVNPLLKIVPSAAFTPVGVTFAIKYHAQQEITEPSKEIKVCICNLRFKDLCLQYKPNSLGRSPTDKSGSAGRPYFLSS